MKENVVCKDRASLYYYDVGVNADILPSRKPAQILYLT